MPAVLPLEGLRVLDLPRLLPGAAATQLLAQFVLPRLASTPGRIGGPPPRAGEHNPEFL